MGCCYSFFCKDDGSSQSGDVNERTHLLVDPVTNNINIQRNNTEEYYSQDSNALPKKTDEQSALNRILQETATNVIDVAALDTHNLQQHEYLDRMKQYTLKVQQVCAANRINFKNKQMILTDIPSVEKVLSTDSINLDDYNMILSAVSKATEAINEIKVEHKEDLVVPFRIP